MSLHDVSAGSLSLVEKTALDDPTCLEKGLVFTKEQFENFDYQFKRRLASATELDEINGKSNQLEMQEYFCQQYSLSDFE
jgi:hypothetical protein